MRCRLYTSSHIALGRPGVRVGCLPVCGGLRGGAALPFSHWKRGVWVVRADWRAQEASPCLGISVSDFDLEIEKWEAS